jgi:hypothetical protein
MLQDVIIVIQLLIPLKLEIVMLIVHMGMEMKKKVVLQWKKNIVLFVQVNAII